MNGYVISECGRIADVLAAIAKGKSLVPVRDFRIADGVGIGRVATEYGFYEVVMTFTGGRWAIEKLLAFGMPLDATAVRETESLLNEFVNYKYEEENEEPF